MFRVFLFLCILLTAGFASAHADMKIEGSCKGQHEGGEISFTYYSTFNGCVNKSKASVTFTSDQSEDLKGTRSIANGLDSYSFKMMKGGQLKTVYWLVFADSTGNTHGDFKYRDSSGNLASVRLECAVYDYEYSDCRGK